MTIGEYSVQHEFGKRFPIWHCLLYYLGWYEKTGNKWDDLRACLIMDGYCGEAFSNADVYRLILGIADDFNYYCASQGWKLISISTLVGDDWWINKYREQGVENPDWLYFIDELMSKFAFDYTRQQVKLPRPDFKKGDPLRYDGYQFGKTYKEANKHTEKYNWYGEHPSWDWREYFNPEYYKKCCQKRTK